LISLDIKLLSSPINKKLKNKPINTFILPKIAVILQHVFILLLKIHKKLNFNDIDDIILNKNYNHYKSIRYNKTHSNYSINL